MNVLTRRVESGVSSSTDSDSSARRIDWFRCIPFILLHVACLGVFWVGISGVAVAVAAFLYFARMFFITGFYHRYFSHRSFRTSRWIQFLGALGGCSAGQRGPIWWAAHHRHHHLHSDREGDKHSPRDGFLHSHMGWFMTPGNFPTDTRYVRDWLRFPELRFIDRFDWLAPLVLAAGTYALGALLDHVAPDLGTSGLQMLVWGFFISTVVLYQASYTINSLAHRFGSRRFETEDDSRNNFWLALLTLGEGWHNNHHYYPVSARQGFVWWEIDVSYSILCVLSRFGLVWGLRPVPRRVLDQGGVSAMDVGGAPAGQGRGPVELTRETGRP